MDRRWTALALICVLATAHVAQDLPDGFDSIAPAAHARGVPVDAVVEVGLGTGIEQRLLSVGMARIMLRPEDGYEWLEGELGYEEASRTLSFRPHESLQAGTDYVVMVTVVTRPRPLHHNWTFRTATGKERDPGAGPEWSAPAELHRSKGQVRLLDLHSSGEKTVALWLTESNDALYWWSSETTDGITWSDPAPASRKPVRGWQGLGTIRIPDGPLILAASRGATRGPFSRWSAEGGFELEAYESIFADGWVSFGTDRAGRLMGLNLPHGEPQVSRHGATGWSEWSPVGFVPSLRSEPRVAYGPNGHAAMAWIGAERERTPLMCARFAPGGGWGTPEVVQADVVASLEAPSGPIALAQGPGGEVLLACLVNDPDRGRLYASRFEPERGWTPLEPLEDGAFDEVGHHQVRVDDLGNAFAFWLARVEGDDAQALFSAVWKPGSGWSEPESIAERVGDAYQRTYRARVAPSGAAGVVSFAGGGPYRTEFWLRRYLPGEGWGPAEKATSANTRLGLGSNCEPTITVARDGRMVAAWLGPEELGAAVGRIMTCALEGAGLEAPESPAAVREAAAPASGPDARRLIERARSLVYSPRAHGLEVVQCAIRLEHDDWSGPLIALMRTDFGQDRVFEPRSWPPELAGLDGGAQALAEHVGDIVIQFMTQQGLDAAYLDDYDVSQDSGKVDCMERTEGIGRSMIYEFGDDGLPRRMIQRGRPPYHGKAELELLYERLGEDWILSGTGDSGGFRSRFSYVELGGVWLPSLLDLGNQRISVMDYTVNGVPTTLHLAVETGDVELVERMIAAGHSLTSLNAFGGTPMETAIGRGDLTMMQVLLDAGFDARHVKADGLTLLHVVAATGDTSGDLMEILIQHGGDPDAREPDDGATPLHYAACNDNAAVARVLVEAGASLEPRDSSMAWTPLHFAAQNDSAAVARVLLEAGADRNAMTTQGMTARQIAEANGSLAVLRELR